jgi:D-glycero-alpha-D-manno-heptose-7-phosphate kinase
MIISRTPLRMSFTGGGSDLPVFFRQQKGAVLSTSIDKYVYVTVNPKFDQGIRVAYSKNEEVHSVAEIEHELVRKCLEQTGIAGGVEITTVADIPSRGTGLGSSSAFTVGLLNALRAFQGRYVSSEELGSWSSKIEIDLCGSPIGKQDQYAAAYGGFNLIEFYPDDSVVVSPVVCRSETIAQIKKNILVFYTGITRSANTVLASQHQEIASDHRKADIVSEMAKMSYQLRNELQKNNYDSLGTALHEGWALKRSITPAVTSPQIDEWYQIARDAGAIGGKILGAGAGGFLLLYAPSERHNDIKAALPLRPIPIGFEPLGSRIIFSFQ